LAEKIHVERNDIDPDFEWERLQKESIQMLTLDDPRYPRLLREIDSPPYIIYIKGDTDWNWNAAPMISIVGSRKFSPYGAQATQTLARDLARAGITIVSGMALGIDALAHRGALDAGGKTIAVLGSSLDDKNIGPRANFGLSREIMQNGILLSDYPLETFASEKTFPARNRIVAGLSLGTLVIEAGEQSGTLITAGLALEYNRDVFAVPGPIFAPQSVGTNRLIQKGAKITLNVESILEELNLLTGQQPTISAPKNPDTEEKEILLQILTHDPLHIDNIAKLSKLGASSVASSLALMEIKGWVKNIGGQNYIIT
jgi:DNA processing protein